MGREGERETSMCGLPLQCPLLQSSPAIQAHALTGNQTGDQRLAARHSIHCTTPARARPEFLKSVSLILEFHECISRGLIIIHVSGTQI